MFKNKGKMRQKELILELSMIIEGTLTIIEYKQGLKRPNKAELNRQIEIAQRALSVIYTRDLPFIKGRRMRLISIIENHNGSVSSWASSLSKNKEWEI